MHRRSMSLWICFLFLVAFFSAHKLLSLLSFEPHQVLFAKREEQKTKIGSIQGDCINLKSCVDCAAAFDSSGCTWCPQEGLCVAAIPRGSVCELDHEDGYCSSIFVKRARRQHFRVVYVGKRTGGPEALIQLHLALRRWGWNSTLESRKKQVGKKLLPYFYEMYEKEFKSLGLSFAISKDFKAFVSSAKYGDVLILTETWPCRKGLRFYDRSSFGARQLQFHLTIQDRSNTYNISSFYISHADPEACGAIAHTNYMANVFLNISLKAVMIPYISPTIVLEGNKQKHKKHPKRVKDIILIDGDSGIKLNDIADADVRKRVRRAVSIKPQDLIEIMKNTAAVVDFDMPGGERLVQEAALFGAKVVINDVLNGASEVDFPIPKRYRVHGRNMTQLNEILREIVNCDSADGHEFAPFRQFVANLEPLFHRSVRRYFSDSMHFISVAFCKMGTDQSINYGFEQLLSIFLFTPFATITVFVEHTVAEFYREHSWFFNFLDAHYLSSSVEVALCSEQESRGRNDFPPFPPVRYAAHLDPAAIIVSEDVVSYFAVHCEVDECPVKINGTTVTVVDDTANTQLLWRDLGVKKETTFLFLKSASVLLKGEEGLNVLRLAGRHVSLWEDFLAAKLEQ